MGFWIEHREHLNGFCLTALLYQETRTGLVKHVYTKQIHENCPLRVGKNPVTTREQKRPKTIKPLPPWEDVQVFQMYGAISLFPRFLVKIRSCTPRPPWWHCHATRYEIGKQLGHGAASQVFSCRPRQWVTRAIAMMVSSCFIQIRVVNHGKPDDKPSPILPEVAFRAIPRWRLEIHKGFNETPLNYRWLSVSPFLVDKTQLIPVVNPCSRSSLHLKTIKDLYSYLWSLVWS